MNVRVIKKIIFPQNFLKSISQYFCFTDSPSSLVLKKPARTMTTLHEDANVEEAEATEAIEAAANSAPQQAGSTAEVSGKQPEANCQPLAASVAQRQLDKGHAKEGQEHHLEAPLTASSSLLVSECLEYS